MNRAARRDPEMQTFLKDRRKALLSLNRKTIEAYMRKYGVEVPVDDDVFWVGIHKARTGATDLPMEARSDSKLWLAMRGYHAMDDGEVHW